MSLLVEKEFACPFCKHPNMVEVWSILNVKEDPELKDLLLGGELNMAECAACRKVFYAENFLIYHDPSNEMMVFAYPAVFAAEREKYQAQAASDFSKALNEQDEGGRFSYEAVALFGLDELVAYVEHDEESRLQSEIAEALSRDNGIPVRKLSPFNARKRFLPTVLPLPNGADQSLRDRLLRGLEALQSLNDRLTVYNEAHEKIRNDKNWDVSLD